MFMRGVSSGTFDEESGSCAIAYECGERARIQCHLVLASLDLEYSAQRFCHDFPPRPNRMELNLAKAYELKQTLYSV